MIYTCKPQKVSIYNNTSRKTAAQIQIETGCDALINGGLFNMSTFKATGNLKANGVEVSHEWDAAQGYSWSGGEIPRFGWSDMKENDNFIGCVAMVENGVALPMNYPSEMGGARQRTAFGTFADGRVWLYASKTPTTPEQLQALAITEGVRDAVMLDGGGSTQGISPTETVSATRIVNHYICVWEDENMSNSPLVDYTLLSPNKSTRTAKISKITIHHMAGNLTVEQCGAVFQYTGRQASSNYGVGTDGRIGLYVEEKNRAWTSSNTANDNVAVTIEVANSESGGDWKVSDKALTATIDLCVDICKRNGIARLNFTGDKTGNLTMHKWFAATACPGPYLESKFGYIADEVNKRLGNKTEEVKTEEKTEEANKVTVTLNILRNGSRGDNVKALQILLNGRGYNCGTADGVFGAKTQAAVRSFQVGNRLSVDGVVGAATWTALLK